MNKDKHAGLKQFTKGIKYMISKYPDKEHDALLSILVALDELSNEIYALSTKRED